jgi:hypothetical protein
VTRAHRNPEYVVERKIARAVAAGVIACSLGNLLAVGCALAWMGDLGAARSAMLLVGAVGVVHFVGGLSALIGYGWAR